jgi:hypothetical protein
LQAQLFIAHSDECFKSQPPLSPQSQSVAGEDGPFGPGVGNSSGILPGSSSGRGGSPGSRIGGGTSGLGLPGGLSTGGSVGLPGVAGGISGGSIGIHDNGADPAKFHFSAVYGTGQGGAVQPRSKSVLLRVRALSP